MVLTRVFAAYGNVYDHRPLFDAKYMLFPSKANPVVMTSGLFTRVD